MAKTIACFYTCSLCGITRRFVDVPERDITKTDVTVWLQLIAVPALIADHRLLSPHCHPTQFAEVGIPVSDDTEHVGEHPKS